MTHRFSDFFETFSGSNGRNRREVRDVIDFFEIYTIDSWMEKKMFEINSGVSTALFWVTQPKQKKIKIIFLPTSLKWLDSLRAHFFQFFPTFFLPNYFPKFFSNFFFLTKQHTSLKKKDANPLRLSIVLSHHMHRNRIGKSEAGCH